MQKLYIFMIAFLFLFAFSVPAQAYNNDWTYKRPIIINNSQNQNILFDYQTLINVSYKNGMKSDFSDIRFTWLNTSSNIEVPISYFIENYTTNLFADIWIKISEINANGYEKVYMYYGNPSAISESNSNSTFELYDNFNDMTLDNSKWDVLGGMNDVSVSNGELSLYGLTWILSNDALEEYIIKEVRARRSGSGGGIYLSLRNDNETNFINEGAGSDWGWWRWDTYNGITSHGGYNTPNENSYHTWKLERNGTASAKIYQDGTLFTNATEDLPSGSLKAGFRGGEYSGVNYYTYVDWVRIRKYADPEPTYSFGDVTSNIGLKTSIIIPKSVQAGSSLQSIIEITDNSIAPITTLSSSDFKIFRDSEQINLTAFRNFNNGTYLMNISSGSIIGNISFRAEILSSSAESFAMVETKTRDNIAIISNTWENILLSGLAGNPVFSKYSETEKYFLSRLQPEQVFVFDNISTEYPTYRFKNMQAFLETFYSNDIVIFVSSREQAISAAPYARLKNYPVLFNADDYIANKFNNIINLSDKTPDKINDIVIKEFSKAGKNINTITITNANAETSALTAAVAAKHNSIIIPMNFSAISYPETVSDFYGLNSANGVMRTRAKINETIKKLSDNFLFSNSIDYKVGRMQLNLVLLGNVSEVPQPVVFDSGREALFDYDSNYLLTDFPYSDTNGDGKADLVTGRVVSPYLLIELPKNNRIITAAIYRNIETVFSGNGLIESQATDAAFRTAGFETVRLVENRTNLSYYELTFGLGNITDFLKKLLEEQSITESLSFLGAIYSGYNELLEHNYYRMMSSMSLGFDGLTIRMFPDERLAREALLEKAQGADGIFYYGKGDSASWFMDSSGKDKFYLNELPSAGAVVYDEHTNSARLPGKTIFEKGASAFIGSSGIIYDIYSFMPNARIVQNMARNKSIALSLESSRYPLLPLQTRNLTASMQFNYQPARDIAIKQFLEMVCYCDPEKKIDPNAQEQGSNPIINYSTTFKSKIKIPIKYFVSGNRIFFNAEQYLQEFGKPIIPLYSAETVLPNGSIIIGISFDYNLSIYGNISADFVPFDEHFNESAEDVHGYYPSQIFYNETFGTLDGRKLVKLIAAGMQYSNDTKEALVVRDAEAEIEYSAPFEFTEFSAENITLDMNQTFKIRSFGTRNLSVFIDIKGGNFSETIERNLQNGYSEISWSPPFAGNFAATAYVLMGNSSAGPRYASFSVNSPSQNFFRIFESLGAGGYDKIMKSFSEKVRIALNGASAFMEYVNPFSIFSSSSNSSAVEKRISSPDYSFSIAQDSGKITYHMKNLQGELTFEKNAGATKETCKGDCSELYEKMDSRLSEMQSLQDYVVENIGK